VPKQLERLEDDAIRNMIEDAKKTRLKESKSIARVAMKIQS